MRCRAQNCLQQRAASSETSLLACDVAGRNGKTWTERNLAPSSRNADASQIRVLELQGPLAAGLRVLLHSDEKRGAVAAAESSTLR